MNIQKDEFEVLAGDGSLQGKEVRHPELLVYTWLERSERKDGLPLFCHFILLHHKTFSLKVKRWDQCQKTHYVETTMEQTQ